MPKEFNHSPKTVNETKVLTELKPLITEINCLQFNSNNSNNYKLDLKIKKMPTAKNKIPQRVLMEKNIIPRHPSSVLFNGSSGSGKSTLLVNLLTRKEFLKDYFDKIFLIAPTGGSDDMFDHIKIKKENVITDMKNAPDFIQKLLNEQTEIIKSKKIHKAPKILIIYEDIQSCGRFMKSKVFLESFIANRHYGLSTWLCGQSFTKTPRACRLQANNIFYFRGGGSENSLIIDEFCPAGKTKKEFAKLIDTATEEPYSFLHINKRVANKERYRKNLDEII